MQPQPPSPPAPRAATSDLPIAILGAGFGGIGSAIRLKQSGIESFTIFERASEIGGTWRDNTYPGAACDVPSHVYSLSFEPSPDWTRAFAPAGEIQGYLLRLVEKWGLRKHLRLQREIVGARFDETDGRWTIATRRREADGTIAGPEETFRARAVICAVGGLVDPQWPEIEGLERFAGKSMHTARWDHGYDLAGKRVGVIGTGASAVQVVPSIAPQVSKLHVFQRTPAWVMPKHDRVYGESTRRWYAEHPLALGASRFVKYWLSEIFGPMVFLDAPRLSRLAEGLSMKHLHAQVRDPVLREKLTPHFQFGCKRILISDDYWKSFERENVELVTDPIARIRPEGVETKDGRVRPLDAIVYATGFSLGITASPFPVTGRSGRTLSDVWKDGAVAYQGMTVSGFPNWWILMGPNTGPGHTSVLVFTEAQIEHALKAIQTLGRERLRFLDVRQDVQDRYNARIQRRMKHMVWSSGCNSWYLSPDGSNHALYPGFAAEYAARARRFRPSDYEIGRS